MCSFIVWTDHLFVGSWENNRVIETQLSLAYFYQNWLFQSYAHRVSCCPQTRIRLVWSTIYARCIPVRRRTVSARQTLVIETKHRQTAAIIRVLALSWTTSFGLTTSSVRARFSSILPTVNGNVPVGSVLNSRFLNPRFHRYTRRSLYSTVADITGFVFFCDFPPSPLNSPWPSPGLQDSIEDGREKISSVRNFNGNDTVNAEKKEETLDCKTAELLSSTIRFCPTIVLQQFCTAHYRVPSVQRLCTSRVNPRLRHSNCHSFSLHAPRMTNPSHLSWPFILIHTNRCPFEH